MQKAILIFTWFSSLYEGGGGGGGGGGSGVVVAAAFHFEAPLLPSLPTPIAVVSESEEPE